MKLPVSNIHRPHNFRWNSISSQNNVDSFLSREYTLNGNYLKTVIMITVKDFRYTPEKVAEQNPSKLNNTLQWKPRGGRHQKLDMIHDYPTQT
jgi:hypothetical protein